MKSDMIILPAPRTLQVLSYRVTARDRQVSPSIAVAGSGAGAAFLQPEVPIPIPISVPLQFLPLEIERDVE